MTTPDDDEHGRAYRIGFAVVVALVVGIFVIVFFVLAP